MTGDRIQHLEANGLRYKELPHEWWAFWKDQNKYELLEQYFFYNTGVHTLSTIDGGYFKLYPDGDLILFTGYRCNGASGPTIDTKSTMRGAFAHDAFYQMIRNKRLGLEWKHKADLFLRKTMLEDGDEDTWDEFRAWYFYQAVDKFGWKACRPKKVSLAKY